MTTMMMTTPPTTQQSFALERGGDADRFRHATTILRFVILMTMTTITFPFDQKLGDDDEVNSPLLWNGDTDAFRQE
jgi:hypothetical protein